MKTIEIQFRAIAVRCAVLILGLGLAYGPAKADCYASQSGHNPYASCGASDLSGSATVGAYAYGADCSSESATATAHGYSYFGSAQADASADDTMGSNTGYAVGEYWTGSSYSGYSDGGGGYGCVFSSGGGSSKLLAPEAPGLGVDSNHYAADVLVASAWSLNDDASASAVLTAPGGDLPLEPRTASELGLPPVRRSNRSGLSLTIGIC